MKAKIVQRVENQFVISIVELENIIPACTVRGYEFSGFNANHRQRTELQGAPTFSGLLGPMWDGDCLRYEDQEANDILSA